MPSPSRADFLQVPEGIRFASDSKVDPKSLVAPLCGGARKRDGVCRKKPWDYRVTVAIPHLGTPECLAACVATYRAQTEQPYILVIDTGSSDAVKAELERMRAADLEIHYIAGHGWRNSSEPVTVAMDVAHALCRTTHLYHTHADCFAMSPDVLSCLLAMCSAESPAVGYRMSPRDWATDEWEQMVGHQALMLHMPTIRASGAMWNFQRIKDLGYEWSGPAWPDTETGFNRGLQAAGIKPVFLGDERNYERFTDDRVDHVRSFAGSTVYGCVNPVAEDMPGAIAAAFSRAASWREPSRSRH